MDADPLHTLDRQHLRLEPGMRVIYVGAGPTELTGHIEREVGSNGHVLALVPAEERASHLTTLAPDSSDVILLAHAWSALASPLATVREAARLLRGNGRLLVVERSEAEGCSAMRDMVQVLENSGWTIHRCENVGQQNYLLEAVRSDESVQS